MAWKSYLSKSESMAWKSYLSKSESMAWKVYLSKSKSMAWKVYLSKSKSMKIFSRKVFLKQNINSLTNMTTDNQHVWEW